MTKVMKKSNLPNRRRLASVEGCKNDLEFELPIMFKAWYEALKNFEKEIVQTKPEARARGFEASLLNSKMIESIQKHFPLYWKFGKYKRFMLRVNGYIVLFKKLDNNDKPMNIKTKMVSALSNQLSLPLFNSETNVEEPVLFFGYRKNKLGELLDPKLVYIDENQVKWVISEDDIDLEDMSVPSITIPTVPSAPSVAEPKVKEDVSRKKASNGDK